MSNKYSAGNYKNSGMSKAQYEKAHGSSSSSKSSSSSSSSSSFNYKALGISDSAWAALGSQGQTSMSVIGSGVMKIVDKNQPLPTVLDKKEMDKLWSEAESDPVIQKTFGEELSTAKDYLNKNIDLLSSDFQNLTKQQQQQYIDAKKTIDETQASAGTAYSGFRTQAQQKADQQQTSVVQSSKNQLQSQLNTLESSYEQRFGSKALSDLGLGGISGYSGDLVGGKYAGTDYGATAYTPTGGVEGTQAQDILAAKLQKQQDLAGDEVQSIELQNIQREKKVQEALNKL